MALGAPPQTPWRLRRKSELLGAPPPDPRWGSAPDPGGFAARANCWGLCPQTPAAAPPQTPLGLRPKPVPLA